MGIQSPDIHSLLTQLHLKSTLVEPTVQKDVEALFRAIFGLTSEKGRIVDLNHQVMSLSRAPRRDSRKLNLGYTMLSLLAFAQEHEINLDEAIRDALTSIAERQEMYQRWGKRKNVAILGSACDCITNGHIAFAYAILNSPCGIDEVWFMPSGEYVGSKRLTDSVHRIAMCKLVDQIDPRFKYFGFEIEQGRRSETLRTMLDLHNHPERAQHRFFFAASNESAVSIADYDGADELINRNEIPFIVVPRPGYPVNIEEERYRWFLSKPHIYLGDAKGLIEMSSTVARNLYRQNEIEEARDCVPPIFHDYIMTHNLYRSRTA